MKLIVAGTGSSGNSYVLIDDMGTKLLLEAGIPFLHVIRQLRFDIATIEACLISHEHKDHCGYIKDVLKYGISIYTNIPEVLYPEYEKCYKIKKIEEKVKFRIINFEILPFSIEHDAVDPLGFMITSLINNKKICFITDSYFCRYKLDSKLNYLLIECNFDDETLRENEPKLNTQYVKRLRESHMSLEVLIEFLKEQNFEQLEHIVLLHGSSKNLNESKTIEELEKIIGITKLTIAKKGMEIVL